MSLTLAISVSLDAMSVLLVLILDSTSLRLPTAKVPSTVKVPSTSSLSIVTVQV